MVCSVSFRLVKELQLRPCLEDKRFTEHRPFSFRVLKSFCTHTATCFETILERWFSKKKCYSRAVASNVFTIQNQEHGRRSQCSNCTVAQTQAESLASFFGCCFIHIVSVSGNCHCFQESCVLPIYKGMFQKMTLWNRFSNVCIVRPQKSSCVVVSFGVKLLLCVEYNRTPHALRYSPLAVSVRPTPSVIRG